MARIDSRVSEPCLSLISNAFEMYLKKKIISFIKAAQQSLFSFIFSKRTNVLFGLWRTIGSSSSGGSNVSTFPANT